MTSRRRASKANTLPIDPALEDDRPPANGPSEPKPAPRGRPQLFYSTAAGSGFELPIHSFPYQLAANLPLPPRPGSVHLGDALQQRRILPGGTGVKDPPKLGPPEVISAPVHFAEGKAADVFPWAGNSPEDVLSEALVKGGFNNKAQIMNEMNTARPSLWSNLKNKSGINTMSTLFVAVLEKRQQNGRLQIPNNFKPPPRLTLRDSNRESWLHDLANPNVSLRRLSRTIPHGLTGQVLLEQCLNKNIPLSRAVWLAKCVGINELRSHKRKGQAGTVTWGRGWTSSVEQFVDSIISSIGQGDWKRRVTYAMQLATYLYKEHLLEDDHFLEWILNSLDTSPSERLFIWVLVVLVSHYWTDMVSCRRRGKRLAESLLNYLSKLYQLEDPHAFSVAIQYLEQALSKLLAIRPACFISPTLWTKNGALLQDIAVKLNHAQITYAVKGLEARNTRLLQTKHHLPSTSSNESNRLFRKLDTVDYQAMVRIEDLSDECMEIMSNATRLIAVLLHWACSCYREGTHRIYLASRLLRRWSHLGADVYDGVMSYLGELGWADSGEPHILFRIVAELVRSKHFSAGRYLQWLIATGSLDRALGPSSPGAWPLRLITEIPLTGLSEQVRNLRCTLLRGTAHSAELEGRALDLAKRNIAQAAPALFGLDMTARDLSNVKAGNLSPTVRLELGIWLRQHVAQCAQVSEHVPTKDPSVAETAAISLITPHDFHVVRSFLEEFDDLAILADVIGIAMSSLDPSVLASAADTLNYHLKAFRAIGAFDPLFGRLSLRYAALRTARFPEREMLLSLQNLGRTVRPDAQVLQLLSYDLSRLEQKNSAAACSPASDNMGETSHYTGQYYDDEIERILSSGTSMDQQMMVRVLRKICLNLQTHVAKGYPQSDNHAAWLWRLRGFDESTFDIVLREWAVACLTTCQIELLEIGVPLLVGSGLMALSVFFDNFRACMGKVEHDEPGDFSSRAMDGLRIVLHSKTLSVSCSAQDAYRFRLEQYKLCHEVDARILGCIGEVVESVLTAPLANLHGELSDTMSSEPVLSIVKYHVVSDATCLSKLMVDQSARRTTDSFFRPILNSLLDPLGRLQLGEMSSIEQVPAIFKIANELSLPLCQSAIEYICSSNTASEGDSVDAISAALLNAVKTAIEEDQSTGLELLTILGTDLKDKIRQHAEREVLDASAFFTNTSICQSAEIVTASAVLVQKYLTVVDATSNTSVEMKDPTVMLMALAERLRGMTHALDNCQAFDRTDDQLNTLSVPELYPWMSALFRLAVAHGPNMLRNATHAQQVGIMESMRYLYSHPILEAYPFVTEHILDVAALLSDHISDDVRNHLSRSELGRATADTLFQFVLGAAGAVDGWLVLTQAVTVSSMLQMSSQPSTPLPLQNQASPYQSPQLPGSGPPTPQQQQLQQRLFNQQQQQRQQMQQAQQAQQMRNYPQYPHHHMQQGRGPPQQLQRTLPGQATPSSLQQMQLMQQMQGYSQQRATQPSPVPSQRLTPAAGGSSVSGQAGGAPSGKLQIGPHGNQQKEIRQSPFVQPRWEIFAESSGNPNLNETAISLSLFGARKV